MHHFGRAKNEPRTAMVLLAIDAGFCIEVADPLDQDGHGLTFDFGQMGVPDIEQHDDARAVTAIPRFMFERIVEREALAFAPGPFFTADADRTVARHD